MGGQIIRFGDGGGGGSGCNGGGGCCYEGSSEAMSGVAKLPGDVTVTNIS
jgi:hypothetical protein